MIYLKLRNYSNVRVCEYFRKEVFVPTGLLQVPIVLFCAGSIFLHISIYCDINVQLEAVQLETGEHLLKIYMIHSSLEMKNHSN